MKAKNMLEQYLSDVVATSDKSLALKKIFTSIIAESTGVIRSKRCRSRHSAFAVFRRQERSWNTFVSLAPADHRIEPSAFYDVLFRMHLDLKDVIQQLPVRKEKS